MLGAVPRAEPICGACSSPLLSPMLAVYHPYEPYFASVQPQIMLSSHSRVRSNALDSTDQHIKGCVYRRMSEAITHEASSGLPISVCPRHRTMKNAAAVTQLVIDVQSRQELENRCRQSNVQLTNPRAAAFTDVRIEVQQRR